MRVNYRSETLRLPISAEKQVCLFKEFNFVEISISTTNHPVTVLAGHYWAHIKDEDNRWWLKCNETSVTATIFSVFGKYSLRIFFYAVT